MLFFSGVSACEEADSRGRSDPIKLDEAGIAAMRKVCKVPFLA